MNHTEFFKSLGNISPVYFFTGEEEYVLKSAVKRLEKELVDESLRAVNLTVLYENADADSICTACETIPFMADKRLIEVWESGFLSSSAKPAGEERLCEYLASPAESAVVVFICQKPDKRKKVYKALQKHTSVEFNALSQIELNKWIEQYLRADGMSIERDALAFLTEYADARPENLKNELDKLKAYKGGGTVAREDITAVVTPSNEYSVFKLTDALTEGNAPKALELLSGMLQNREGPIYLLGAVSAQYRRLLRFKLMKGASRAEIIKTLGIRDFMYSKLESASGRLTEERAKKAVDMCIEADEGLKTGKCFAEAALHKLVCELCGLIK